MTREYRFRFERKGEFAQVVFKLRLETDAQADAVVEAIMTDPTIRNGEYSVVKTFKRDDAFEVPQDTGIDWDVGYRRRRDGHGEGGIGAHRRDGQGPEGAVTYRNRCILWMESSVMAYTSIAELPTEVRNSLDERDSERWMEEYNRLSKDGDTRGAYRQAWRACMTLPSSFSFKIMASVEDVDSDGEVITLDTLRDNLDSFIEEGGKVQQAHSNYTIGTIWDYEDAVCPETGKPGIAVYGNVFGGRGTNTEYARAREDFLDGQNSLSIGADASVEGYECDDDRCFTRRNVLELMEISLCRTPANPYATLIWYNDGAVVKSKDDVSLRIDSLDVHRSYGECTYERIRRDMGSPTVRARVARDGCRLSSDDEVGLMEAMDARGYRYGYDIAKGEFVATSPEYEMERAFKAGLRDGWLDVHEGGDGRTRATVSDSVPVTEFMSLYSSGLIRKGCGGGWELNYDIFKEGGCMGAGTSGASNARYSDDKAFITFEEIMDWRSRIAKDPEPEPKGQKIEKRIVLAQGGEWDDAYEFSSIRYARDWAVEQLQNDPSTKWVAIYDRDFNLLEEIVTQEYIDEEYDGMDLNNMWYKVYRLDQVTPGMRMDWRMEESRRRRL